MCRWGSYVRQATLVGLVGVVGCHGSPSLREEYGDAIPVLRGVIISPVVVDEAWGSDEYGCDYGRVVGSANQEHVLPSEDRAVEMAKAWLVSQIGDEEDWRVDSVRLKSRPGNGGRADYSYTITLRQWYGGVATPGTAVIQFGEQAVGAASVRAWHLRVAETPDVEPIDWQSAKQRIDSFVTKSGSKDGAEVAQAGVRMEYVEDTGSRVELGEVVLVPAWVSAWDRSVMVEAYSGKLRMH